MSAEISVHNKTRVRTICSLFNKEFYKTCSHGYLIKLAKHLDLLKSILRI